MAGTKAEKWLEGKSTIPLRYLMAAYEAPGDVIWPFDPEWEKMKPLRTVGWIDKDDPEYSGQELELLEFSEDKKILARFTTFRGNDMGDWEHSCYVILDEEGLNQFRRECQDRECMQGAEYFDEPGAWDG